MSPQKRKVSLPRMLLRVEEWHKQGMNMIVMHTDARNIQSQSTFEQQGNSQCVFQHCFAFLEECRLIAEMGLL